ncbi:Putative ER membrane protein complex subunit 7 [Septoria linicola]|uniref:ER membrane protein complex subunit 7 n=1 Tax=Septoria linicola TaxID=215465 RepID=A0A9Q9ANY5_9PEZI|nr:Putative ER membrane protein complex subunit 7 [Septoria linicola]
MASIRKALLLACAALAPAARLTVSIPPSQLLPNPSTLPASSHAVLLGPPGVRYDAPIRRDNTFWFENLPDASYLLTIHSRDYFFPPLRVDVSPSEGESSQNISAWATFRGNEWSNKGQSFGSGKDELQIDVRAGAEKQFYQQRSGFSILSFLKSPMILMGLVSVVLIFGMPYLMDNMDPEAKAEFEEMSAKNPITGGGGAAAQMQNFDLAGFLAGTSKSSGDGAADSKKK